MFPIKKLDYFTIRALNAQLFALRRRASRHQTIQFQQMARSGIGFIVAGFVWFV